MRELRGPNMTAAEQPIDPDLVAREALAHEDRRGRYFLAERAVVEAILDRVFCQRCNYGLVYCTCKGWQARRGEVEARHQRATRGVRAVPPRGRSGPKPMGRLGGPPKAGTR